MRARRVLPGCLQLGAQMSCRRRLRRRGGGKLLLRFVGVACTRALGTQRILRRCLRPLCAAQLSGRSRMRRPQLERCGLLELHCFARLARGFLEQSVLGDQQLQPLLHLAPLLARRGGRVRVIRQEAPPLELSVRLTQANLCPPLLGEIGTQPGVVLGELAHLREGVAESGVFHHGARRSRWGTCG